MYENEISEIESLVYSQGDYIKRSAWQTLKPVLVARTTNKQNTPCTHVFKQCAAHSVICETCSRVFPLR